MSRYIAIEGPIGVGKSSLAKMLGERFEVEPIYEQVEENPFLDAFYRDKATYAFQTQMFFLVSRYKQLSELSQVDLFNQVTVCDYIMERDLVFAKLNLDDSEYRLYLDIYNQVGKTCPRARPGGLPAGGHIDPDENRISIRNRDAEQGISEGVHRHRKQGV